MTQFRYGLGLVATAALAATAMAKPCDPTDPNTVYDLGDPNCFKGQVNIAGATLFADFYSTRGSTNDFIDVDGDGDSGSTNQFVDQLAEEYDGTYFDEMDEWWLLQVRSVGSVNGYREFVTWQLIGEFNADAPSETGVLNRDQWATNGAAVTFTTSFGTFPAAAGSPWTTWGTPEAWDTVDLAILDVPGSWATTITGTPKWDRNPGQGGFGLNEQVSWDAGFGQKLVTLAIPDPNDPNTLLELKLAASDPNGPFDNDTLFDTTIAWGPVVPISTQGSDIESIAATDLQYLLVTGRLSNGNNIVGSTRDAGSGTRNGYNNTLGIDPSWGRGDNLGSKWSSDDVTVGDPLTGRLGPAHNPTNNGGSSRMETVVQNRRMAIGYTGLAGGSRAAKDSVDRKYEVLNVINDDMGGSNPVRPNIASVIDTVDPNDNNPMGASIDPNAGYFRGGPISYVSRGNPFELDPNVGEFMENQAAASFLRNIAESVANFSDPNLDPNSDTNFLQPGEVLALDFFLLASIDALPNLSNPDQFSPIAGNNGTLQGYTQTNNDLGFGGDTPAYGSTSVANRVPDRDPSFVNDNGTADPNDDFVDAVVFDDGSTNGDYHNWHVDVAGSPSIAAGANLNGRNRVMGDFNGDDDRDPNDIALMMSAVDDNVAYTLANSTPNDPVVPELIGDFDGDGNFTAADVRYFADGLAIDPTSGNQNRTLGFTSVDTAWAALGNGDNYFGTSYPSIAFGAPIAHAAGYSRGDVAGSTDGAYPGAYPNGADNEVDCDDVDYVCANFGDWSDIDQAVFMDLSCDMNGDLVVDATDKADILETILDSFSSDVNCDGSVDSTDLAVMLGNFGTTSGGLHSDGDLDCNGTVDSTDLALLLGQFGSSR